MSSTSKYLSVVSGHIDSLISYVADVKPYHVKLSEIVEQYVFSESINVKIVEDNRFLAFLGADILPNILAAPGVRRRRSASWAKNVVSDGFRRTWPVPITAIHKFASQYSQDKFKYSDTQQVEGFPSKGVFNIKRWSGPGITNVRKNNVLQQESTDYFLSHGAFTFTINANRQWKENNLKNISAFAANTGALLYKDVLTAFGAIRNIQHGNYEEWTCECIGTSPVTLSISGSISGQIGTVIENSIFDDENIRFEFNTKPEDSGVISIGDKFVLTPFHKITIASDAPEETWSLIKTNPIALVSRPVFHSPISRSVNPGIQIHTRSLDRQVGEITWTIVFGENGDYTLNKYALNDSYSVHNNLVNGCSFKNDDIHFTILTTGDGFYPGDSFSFTTGPTVSNYKVYGTVSGWQQDASIGEWYWNGKIGFKIPPLEYFADTFNSTVIISNDATDDSWSTVVKNNQILNSISFQAGVFVVAGDDQIVGASSDGTRWYPNIQDHVVTNNNEIIILTGYSGAIAISSDGGATWQKQDTFTDANLNASTFIPNLLTSYEDASELLNCIIVVGNNGTILTSVNGEGWAIRDSNTTEHLNGIAWSNDAIIVVGNNGAILKSFDRINWSKINSNTSANLNDIVYEPASNNFVAVGDDGVILRSTDGGNTWLNLSVFTDGTFNSIAFGNGKFVAVGKSGWTATSNDAIEWTRYRSKRLNSIAFGGGKFVAVGGKANDEELFTPLKSVHSMAEPSVYSIRFLNDTTGVVSNNIYGYKKCLTVGEDWEDEFVKFRLDSIPGQFEYQVGDEVRVYLAPSTSFTVDTTYDKFPYDNADYDIGRATITTPALYNQELFPLYHSHGAVIFPECDEGDSFVIDKATHDRVKLKIQFASAKYPELYPLNDNDIPLYFKYYDRVVNEVPTSEAHFSDLTTYIEAYLCSAPNVKVFSIAQPRFEKSNRNSNAVLTFDKQFFNKYLSFGAQYTLTFLPDESYGQIIRVKITENLCAFVRVRMNFSEIANIHIVDSPIQHFEIAGKLDFYDTANISFVEGGALPLMLGYDEFPYDTIKYDDIVRNGVLPKTVETAPNEYTWTGNELDWTIPKPTTFPSIHVQDTVDENTAQTNVVEGLTIIERIPSSPGQIDRLSVYYDNDRYLDSPMMIEQTANSYLITHNGLSSTPTVIIESQNNPGVFGQVIPNMYPFAQFPSAISLKSFSFELPAGFTAPFKLTIT